MGYSITAKDLRIGYSSTLANINTFDIEQGEIVSIIGESGIGKTTFLKTIANLIAPLDGDLQTFEQQTQRIRGRIGYIPQKLGLVKHASVFSNVLQGAICNEPVWRSITGFHEERTLGKVHDTINLMGLSDKSEEPISKLSGGQQRRVAIARTIAQNPKLILADEFLSELDAKTAEKVWKTMLEYVKENEITLVIVEHNIDWANLAERCFKMEKSNDDNYPNLVEVK